MTPARTQTEVCCLVLHRDSSNRSILTPRIRHFPITQHNNCHLGTCDELAAHRSAQRNLLQQSLVIHHHKMPGTCSLARWRHQCGTKNRLQVFGFNIFICKLAHTTASLH